LIPFLDWAETFVTDPLSYESDRSILGSGVGLEMKFSKGLQARLDFAKPLREIKNGGTIVDGTRSSDNRVHALVVWEF
jgi:hemolysin activation/secretion protein